MFIYIEPGINGLYKTLILVQALCYVILSSFKIGTSSCRWNSWSARNCSRIICLTSGLYAKNIFIILNNIRLMLFTLLFRQAFAVPAEWIYHIQKTKGSCDRRLIGSSNFRLKLKLNLPRFCPHPSLCSLSTCQHFKWNLFSLHTLYETRSSLGFCAFLCSSGKSWLVGRASTAPYFSTPPKKSLQP